MKSKPQTLQDLVLFINSHLQSLGIDWETFQEILLLEEQVSDPKENKRIQEAAFTVIKKQEIPKNLKDFQLLIEKVNDLFDINLPLDAFNTGFRGLLKNIWITFIFLFVFYMVIGGIIEGQSGLIKGKGNVLVALAALGLMIIIIAALEGLQISVMALRLKDVSGETSYPRAISLHRRFKSAQNTNRFLAGRQLLVVVVVYFAAQLTSFPEMTKLPFINVTLPENLVCTVFRYIFLKSGVLGALLILWFGQLVPQFVANNNPIYFLNMFGMGMFLQISYRIESLQLTRPADWAVATLTRAARRLGTEERPYIHISLREKYRQEAEQIQGYGIVMQSRSWEIRPNTAQLSYKSIYVIYAPNLNKLLDRSLVVKESPRKLLFSSKLIRNGTEIPKALEPRVSDEDNGDGWRLFQMEISSLKGTFQPGDTIQTKIEMEFSFERSSNLHLLADQLHISKPTRYIMLRAFFVRDPYAIRNSQIQVFRQDEISPTNPKLLQDIPLGVLKNKRGIKYISWGKFYPELGTHYKFSCEVEYLRSEKKKAGRATSKN
jgi:hypothetical protein